MKEAKNRLTELVRNAEAGQTITLTRNGHPVADLVPHKDQGGSRLERIEAAFAALGVDNAFPYVAPDFDDPLPADFLITPLPRK